MEFRTIIPLPDNAPRITPTTRAVVVGSCFAEHIGARLRDSLSADNCCLNPFGVLYNPISIAQAIKLLLNHTNDTPLPDGTIFHGRDGLWHSWLHSTHYSGESEAECRQRCQQSLNNAHAALATADLLIVTFGTNRCYEREGQVVSNCHKELSTTFTERDYTAAEIIEIWQPLLTQLRQQRPDIKVVFTISPYRYRKYGYHASQLSKAQLLLAVEKLTLGSKAPTQSVSYFPAYEIMLDELRDYRFYKPDMLHPSEQAIDYIWERFQEWTFTPEMHNYHQQRIKQLKALNHHANH